MKKIVVIGANEFQFPLIEKANELGYETHVFAWEDGAVSKEIADYFYPISIVEKEIILEKCREIQPDAVMTIASDLANITAQYVARKLGLVCNSEKCVEQTTNKYAMRQALKNGGIKTPYFFKVENASELRNQMPNPEYPLIVKPTDRSGSRGIFKVTDESQLEEAIRCAAEYSFEHKAIVEGYLEGKEYSCECISYQGKHTLLAITEKYTTGAPSFIERGHIQPSGLSKEVAESVRTTVYNALDVLQVENGPSHTEIRISGKKINIIEIGSRMGGDCIGSHLVQLSTGIDFVKATIDVAVGQEPQIAIPQNNASGIRFVFDESDLETLSQIEKCHANQLVHVSALEELYSRTIVDSGSRLGFYVVNGTNRENVKELLQLEDDEYIV
ncbi:MAG: ATP-grasp domain-containing protein [Lachnospiraceae bacterium]|nr:ATP-grasp domain-containing protein [Lachnospiraceae bacterium]